MSDPYDFVIEIDEGSGIVTTLEPSPSEAVVVYFSPPELVEVVTAGPQGIPGAGVILLEASETEPPVDTPEGSIIFRKLS